MNYIILKNNKEKQIVYMEYDVDGFKIGPFKNSKMGNVATITIYKKEMVNNLVSNRFKSQFNRLTEIILRFLNEDDDNASDTDCMMILDDVERLRISMELDYKKFMHNQEYIEYIHKLAFLDNQVRQRLAYLNYQAQMEYEAYNELENVGVRRR